MVNERSGLLVFGEERLEALNNPGLLGAEIVG
jgi:hypothetical protein